MSAEIKMLEDLFPHDTPEYMFPMWIACMSWAIGEAGIVEAFTRETGLKWRPASSPIERMIDEASGADRHFVEQFIRWANVNVWGPIDGEA